MVGVVLTWNRLLDQPIQKHKVKVRRAGGVECAPNYHHVAQIECHPQADGKVPGCYRTKVTDCSESISCRTLPVPIRSMAS